MKERHPISLDEQLVEFYGQVELSSSAIAQMLAHVDRRRPPARGWMAMAGVAAAVILTVVIVSLLDGGGTNIAELAMAEVAENHLKGIAPEAVSSDYSAVQEHLSRLNFSIKPPAGGLIEGFDLIGGRYCKVQGEFAAQLKLRPRHGGPAATAYVVPAEGPLAMIEKPVSAVFHGVRVRCERSGHRLIFLAEPAQEN
jgi:hypothetical protein